MAENNEELVKEAIDRAAEMAKAKAETESAQAEEAENASETETAAEAETCEEAEACDEASEENEEESADGEAEPAEGESKKSFFKKHKKKDELAEKDAEIAELKDRLLRQLAEFDNYRKRTEKEKAAMFDMGAKHIIEKLLPTLDSFERGFATVEEADKEDAFVLGMQNVHKQLFSSLSEAGLKTIEAEGQQFDPNLHNAVMHEDNPELGENVVVQEFQKGYTYKDSVVRHSMVKVAN